MKKLILFITLILLQISIISAQELTELYKTGKITFKPDSDFGAANSYFENEYNNFKRYTNIVFTENGAIFLLDRKKYQVLKFNKHGNLVKAIDLNLNKSNIVYDHVKAVAILDNKYLLIRGYAFIKIYDLSGKFIKSIDFDYPIYSFVSLKNNKVGIKGFVQLKNGKTKMHVAVVDIHTEKERPVIAFIKDQQKEHLFFKTKKSGMVGWSSPQRAPKIYINSTLDGNLIVGNSKKPEILIYDIEGKLLNIINLTYSPIEVGQEEKDGAYQNLKQTLEKAIKKYGAPDSLLEVIKSPDFYYQNMPYYYGIKVDSENNILVFKHSKDKSHSFRVYQVYSNEGKFVCETTLEPGEFENPSLRLSAFSKGYLFALLKLKDDKGGLKLVKGEIKPAL
jgi:hypothetical protein